MCNNIIMNNNIIIFPSCALYWCWICFDQVVTHAPQIQVQVIDRTKSYRIKSSIYVLFAEKQSKIKQIHLDDVSNIIL